MIFRDDCDRLIHAGERDELVQVLTYLYDRALRDTFVSNDEIADAVFQLIEDQDDGVTGASDAASATR